ncbi:Receptor-like protein EIX2 [Glycine max]|nr:Receptor-like protein EIX2 [Glycine max]
MCVPLTIHMLYICMAIGSAKWIHFINHFAFLIITTKMPTINPVRFKFMQAIITFMMKMLQVVCAEEEIMCIEREREALLQFKAALVDDYGMLSSWTASDCCQWQGIRCTNLTGHVLMLDLHGEFPSRGLYMRGEIHKSLMELQQLKYLNLSWNSFQGRGIPEFLGSLTNLRYLDLSHSDFEGKIPTQFGSLSHLKYLNLASNSLEGSIPRQLGNLSQLQHLDLGDNQFEGNIPSQIGNLSQLLHLDLSYNSFEGSIPSQLGNLSNLQKLYLGGSHYYDDAYGGALKIDGGALKIDDGDHWVSNLISLTHLSLVFISNLNTSHSFLQMIAKLPTLRELSLSECSLSDQFILSLRPSKFNFSSSLSILDLSSNSFTSSMILQWLSNVTSNLVELDLSDNHLTEDLPSILHNLSSACVRHSLQDLDFKYNQITGSIPDLSVFSSLRSLFLDGNKLSGKIPEGIRLPFHLKSLSIRSNSLEGGIPKSFGNSCALSSLDMSYNNLNKELAVIIHQLSGCARFSLQELNLRGNQINGTLLDLSIFSALKRMNIFLPSLLESLSIRSNILEGGIPKSFGNACALRSLDMSNNSLSEEFPMIIHHLSGCARYSLEQLSLSMNQINGTLPDLSIFSSLRGLYLYGNKLNGEIPKDIKFPPQLEELDMQSNSLKGVLTDYHFANMSKLVYLELSDNSLVTLAFSQNWVPPFQLRGIGLRSCQLGPVFPKWLKTQNQFQGIDISNAGIADMVPKWFWANFAFRKLISMNISYNNLHGIIPNFPIRNIQDSLILGSNQFDGPIPLFLRGSLFLDLSKNQFSDSLSFLCANGTVETLYKLDLSNNHFSGKIPDCWSHFKSLTYLDLSHNNFSGRIPTSMGSLLHLQALLLRNNNLIDEIPFSLRSCTNLVMLDIAENRLSGLIPAWIGSKLQELQFLSLGRNNFHGSLPLQICYLSDIQLLDVSLNSMSGQIPKCIKNFTSMTQKTSSQGHSYYVNTNGLVGNQTYYLNAFLMWKGSEQMFKNNGLLLLKSIDLSSNHFSGEIPLEIENLFGLVSLNLSRNHLTGAIPSNIGKLTSLDFLDLSRNHLVGSIPWSLTQIDRLGVLDLSHNNLSGEIPTGTQLQSFNASCYEDNLDLCGPPLEKLCIDGKPAQEPIVKLPEDEKLLFTREFYMGMAIGFVISFWGVFGSILIKQETPVKTENLFALVSLNLSRNKLTGKIPSNIRNLRSLEFFDLLRNLLDGSIPQSLTQINRLFVLDRIRCTNLTGHVLMLDLHGGEFPSRGHYIRGEIHKSLMELQQLNYLNLSWNDFQGRGIPEFLGSLTNLRYLDLEYCRFGGKIPTQFGSLSHLKYLNLALNSLEGSIPRQLGNLSQLQHLDLSVNQFEGNIPSQLGNLSNLQKLYLGGSYDVRALKIDDGDHWVSNLISLTHLSLVSISNLNTSHSFLQMIAKLPILRELSLSECSLSDPFILSLRPSKFNFSSSLSILDLSINSFTSSMILQWLSNVTSNLVELDLSYNLLEGSTSNHFGRVMNSLEHLYLSYNIFKGEDLKSFANICTLHSLYMPANHLTEDLPSILHNLSSGCVRHSLQDLDLSDNQITGSLPDLSVFSSLRSLFLDGNKLSGKIPEGIRLPFHLKSLSIQSNSLEGGIPKSFGNSCALSSLDMSDNNLNKELAVIIHQLSGCARFSLQELYLTGNQINGRIPTSMGSLLQLQALLLRNNNLTDEIPFSLRSCTNLVMLDIAENRLSGLIPAWIGSKLQELQFLSLGRNNFHGSLPLQICYLSDIQLLDVSLNSMSGQIPKCIKNFTSMTQKTSSRDYQGHSYLVNTSGIFVNSTYDLNALLMWKGSEQMFKNNVLLLLKSIDLSSNHFSGEIPLEIEDLFGLVSLNLSRNHFTGKIPSNIGKLTSLESLDLSRNQLVGSIPPSLTQIYWLSVLDLSHNHLTGKIPTSTQLQSFNASSYEDNLDLCGPPLKKLCIDGKPAQEPIVKLPEDENLLFTREFYMSMAIGFVISFWGVFGSILMNRSWRHAYFKFLNNLRDNICAKVAMFPNKISKAALVDDYGMLSSWTTSDCCQWQGILCSNLTGHVLMLHLSWNSFQGRGIPEFLGSLSNLRYLDLSYSDFGGKIPTQFGSLSHLKYLDLGRNSLEGSIPRQLGNLSQLLHLDLSYNSFEGSIPSQLGNLSNLQKLYLGGSYYESGALKIDDGDHWVSNLISLTHLSLVSISNLNTSHSFLQMIAKLPTLRELSLSECSLSDQFILSLRPSKFNFSSSLSILDLSSNSFTSSMILQWLSNVTSNLVELHLSENNFSEDLPSILHNLSSGCVRHSLQDLDLSYNQITGSLPDLSVFSSLKTLVLNQNQLSGNIPEGIRLPFHLESLSIQSNSLEGGIPKSFGNSCALRSLDMSRNNLNKELSEIIHQLSGCARFLLQELNIRGNQINGTLSDLSIFSALKTLDLSENQLNGKIPESTKLPSLLESLSIESNSLEGGIHKSFGDACALRSLDMSNNSLSEEFPMIIHHLSGCARYSLEQLYLGMNQINGTLPDLSIFSSLRELYLDGNKLNGEIPKDIKFPPQLEQLDMQSNSLKGVLTDYHFTNMSKLDDLKLSDNSLLALAFSQNWVPPFQLSHIGLRSCKLGPVFPKWLETQNQFLDIDISNAGIADMVPKWFWANLAFREFISMDISYNNLHGIIPNFPTKNIQYSLILGPNQFEDPVPPFLRGSVFLDLSKNKFSDSLSFLCANGTVETLYQLDLSNNHFSGKIPDCWSHFKSLSYLDLSHNNFSGRIPTSMGSLLQLQALLLRNNNLTDEIPFSLRSCTNLVMLDIAENRLSGLIPAWIGSKLQELQFLSLGRNNFHGSLPLQICYLSDIQLLDVSLNSMSGQIPKCIKNFTSMTQKTSSQGHSYYVNTNDMDGNQTYDLNAFLMWKGSEQMFKNNGLLLLKSIDLSSNHFSGEIPLEIENLFGLVSLNLSRNHLTGKIPSNIGKLTSLDFLDLSRNHLVGSIPLSLTQIDRLGMLDLSHNNLSGEIPTGTQLQSFNASCYEDNLDLCGPPLEKLCIDGKPAQEPIVKLPEDEKLLFTREFYMSMAIGFVISFWGVFGSILIKRSWRHAYFKFISNLSDAIYVMKNSEF